MIRLDATAGVLEAEVDPIEWSQRAAAPLPSGLEHEGMGRELFAFLRRSVGPAEAGASIFSRERAGAK